MYITRFLLFFAIFVPVLQAHSQKIEIKLGADEIRINEPWTITLSAFNTELKSYDAFPDIEGFRKGAPATRSSTSYINGAVSSVQSVIMTYLPRREGVVKVPSFNMKVNNQFFRVKGKQVTVKPPSAVAQRPGGAIPRRLDDFFGSEEPEYVDIKEDAFLALTTDKKEVYVGQGVNATLAFYMAENNRAPLQFYNISKQLADILKKIKPANCWEENFDIENIEGVRVTMNGKDYVQWKIYQAVFFPLNTQTISFPSVGLEMLKPKVARNPSFFSPNTQEGYKVFYSKPVTVTVKDLPPHPLSSRVAVGEFRLDERISGTDLTTGQSSAYQFNILGEGNIAYLEKPEVKDATSFEIYEPSVTQEISRKNSRVSGKKNFSYFIIPKEPGSFSLAPVFQWVYFSPQRERYDTLRSSLTVSVTGKSRKNEEIDAHDPGSFYEKIAATDNELKKQNTSAPGKWAFHAFLVLMAGASAFLLFRR